MLIFNTFLALLLQNRKQRPKTSRGLKKCSNRLVRAEEFTDAEVSRFEGVSVESVVSFTIEGDVMEEISRRHGLSVFTELLVFVKSVGF